MSMSLTYEPFSDAIGLFSNLSFMKDESIICTEFNTFSIRKPSETYCTIPAATLVRKANASPRVVPQLSSSSSLLSSLDMSDTKIYQP